ncbi:exodeoxyribonuclease VII small subunit [Gammaproteobacteria bacterium]|nr:exodeoxyribonuclease VII small subunit [Gammaproteobacteria bacterium]MDA7856236.1 exodeoxyribonuclease VII small subunit [Gammaproteobacteria bacterium]MDA8696183.1 exodeoxyribonuclease VII small subunit [Gammaproteobacteria bacterium]MDA8957300.1 exodeoxyribonuclease VII small subunit [Gammaproteobacteria bacterium]MDA9039363.1 exodeoxyribonuclease VII small subunit [Gammaproteobacteria bacterium]|tara:strand:- start:332 stop:550 length:219 start_codon:yes stop_codon:yes gene_type:complete
MTKDNENINFESALSQLEKIVLKLEDDSIDLEDSVKSFEQGIELVKKCQKQLKDAELKVSKLLDDGTTEEEV